VHGKNGKERVNVSKQGRKKRGGSPTCLKKSPHPKKYALNAVRGGKRKINLFQKQEEKSRVIN